MATSTLKRDRLSVDVLPEEHRQIKAMAALRGLSIREFVRECIQEHLRRETEDSDLMAMTTRLGTVFEQVWDNEKDSAYDEP
jgi:hypothetical protein